MEPSLILQLVREASIAARINSLKITSGAKTSHIGSCLSVVDILSYLFGRKKFLKGSTKDDIILSKGHAAAALYSVLDHYELLDADLDIYCKNDSPIYGHINHHASATIPLSTGSLGHGFPFGIGIALAKKINKSTSHTFVVISDGELNEGTTWESFLIGAHQELSKFTLIIDRNRIQSLGFTEEVLTIEPLVEKVKSFGWECIEIDGHDLIELDDAVAFNTKRPKCIIANTVKGKGVTFMENTLAWHYKSANSEELELAISEVQNRDKNA